MECAKPDGARDHFDVVLHDVDDLLPLVGVQRTFGDEQGFMRDAHGHAYAAEVAWGELLILVGKDASDPQRSGLGIYLIVDEIHHSMVGMSLFVGQPEPDG